MPCQCIKKNVWELFFGLTDGNKVLTNRRSYYYVILTKDVILLLSDTVDDFKRHFPSLNFSVSIIEARINKDSPKF